MALVTCSSTRAAPLARRNCRRSPLTFRRRPGRHLHIVVVTHEHSDHIAGFVDAKSFFEAPMQIDELWLAWPENDPDKDPLVKQLSEKYGNKAKALTAAVAELKQSGDPLVMGYSNMIESVLLGVDKQKEKENVYAFLKSLSMKKKPPPYLMPSGPSPTLPGVGVSFHVLGPPRDIKLIAKTDPPKPSIGPPLLDEWTAFSLGALAAKGEDGLREDEKEAYLRSLPFEKKSTFRIPEQDLEALEKAALKKTDETASKYFRFFQKYYFRCPAWRRIDTDWLTGGLSIALEISAVVNNTSLVLAIELTESASRKVLLFVGDAQVGNWNSWATSHGDLIGRTVFYKVGHHGSTNATLIEQVDNMSNELVAMIPVDEEWAKKQGWPHPSPAVVKKLKEKTKGRILRADRIPPEKPDDADTNEWQDFIGKHVKWDTSEDKLWIQYTVQG